MNDLSDELASETIESVNATRKYLKFIWRFHRRLIISLLVFLAVFLVVFRSLAYYLEANPHVVKSFLEENLQTEVDFKAIDVHISPFFPSLSMDNFVIRDADHEQNYLEFSSAKISLNLFYSLYYRQAVIDSFSLNGGSAAIRRDQKGDFFIADLQLTSSSKKSRSEKASKPAYLQLLNQTDFVIYFKEIFLFDETHKFPSVFISDVAFKMENSAERHQLVFHANLNETETSVDLRLDFYGDVDKLNQWNGQVYGAIENLTDQSVLHFLEQDVLQIENYQVNNIKGNIQFWSEISQGSLQSVKGELLVDDANLNRVDTKQKIRFDQLRTLFRLERFHTMDSQLNKHSKLWAIDLYDLSVKIDSRLIADKHLSLHYKPQSQEQVPEVQVFLNELVLGELSHVVSFFSPGEFNKRIYKIIQPEGRLENIIVQLKMKNLDMPVDITHYQIQANIRDYGNNAFQSLPKIRNFSGQLVMNKERGQVILDSQDMSVHLKSLFRDTWPVRQFSGLFYWQKEGDGWLFGGNELSVKNSHLSVTADIKLWLDQQGQILMDLTGFYHDANVKYTSLYLPVSIMSDNLVKWLDESIVSGTGTDGGVVFRGLLNEFPYKTDTGGMDIVFNASDVVLEYQKGWPELHNTKAQLQFTEKGMWIESPHSNILSSTSNNTMVTIEKFLDPILKIDADLKGSASDGLVFLQQSKLLSEDLISTLDVNDNIFINLDLSIPLKRQKKIDTKVTVTLNDAEYYPPGLKRKQGLVSHLKGDVVIHNQSIQGKALTATIMNKPAEINIITAKSQSTIPDTKIFIDTQSTINNLLDYEIIPPKLNPVMKQLSGNSQVKIQVDLPNQERPFSFTVLSDLKGIDSKLPEPLKKSEKQSLPLKFEVTQVNKQIKDKKMRQAYQADVKVSNLASIALLLDAHAKEMSLLKGSVHFGSEQAKLPLKTVMNVTGKLPELPYEEWEKVFASQTSNKSDVKASSDVIPLPVNIAMSELVLPELIEVEHDTKKSTPDKSMSSIKPAQFPVINGHIDALKMGSKTLGKVTIRSSRVEKSIIFDELKLTGDLLAFNGNGKWHQWGSVPEVDVEGSLHVPSMGKALSYFGYQQIMRQGDMDVSGYFSWPGSLADFNKATLEGKISIDIQNGAYLEGKPGAAGRVLGLLNMNALARRISLDFSDVHKKGYEFDSIKGDFRLNQGGAYTENLRIQSPSTRLLVTGRIGLVEEDFDQRVTVIPEVSATLPLAGAAVAGPAGAAVVWVGQKLLGEQINRVTAFDYTVKGGWDEPVITRARANRESLKKLKKLFHLDSEAVNGESVEQEDGVLDEEGDLP